MKPKSSFTSCCQCDAVATVFVTLMVDGEACTKAFCQKHAEEAGVLDPKGYDLLGAWQDNQPALSRDTACPHCGKTRRQFEKNGRLGCPHCYTALSSCIEPIIHQVQHGSQHVGKHPRKRRDPVVLSHRLHHLHQLLNRAVHQERFEDAASVRDKIAAIQVELKS